MFDKPDPSAKYPVGLKKGDLRPEPPTRGNSIKAQLEEIWNRPGVCGIFHVTRWHEENGRVTGYSFGKLLHPKQPK